jgi:hypothetical protein
MAYRLRITEALLQSRYVDNERIRIVVQAQELMVSDLFWQGKDIPAFVAGRNRGRERLRADRALVEAGLLLRPPRD